MAKLIKAKYASKCRDCGASIRVGEYVLWTKGAGVVHQSHGAGALTARAPRGDVVSTRCEDYPCCGHGPAPYGDGGGCPRTYASGAQTFDCTGCGAELPVGATSALCARCRRAPVGAYERAERNWQIDSAFYDPDEDVVDWRVYGA